MSWVKDGKVEEMGQEVNRRFEVEEEAEWVMRRTELQEDEQVLLVPKRDMPLNQNTQLTRPLDHLSTYRQLDLSRDVFVLLLVLVVGFTNEE